MKNDSTTGAQVAWAAPIDGADAADHAGAEGVAWVDEDGAAHLYADLNARMCAEALRRAEDPATNNADAARLIAEARKAHAASLAGMHDMLKARDRERGHVWAD